MGEVYRARDTKLGRDVALKLLPDDVARDPDRLARFRREAQLLASLNHPGIAGIYGLEETETSTALVLELVDGPTLADRITDGPMPLDEALPIARQIAQAIEAAHEAGIVHRDLKPANIKLRPDGTVKVLDFGLAKSLTPTFPDGSSMSMPPTVTSPALTQAGLILGTAAYMSPEQARGRFVDRRADIWSFGVVLFEMLTGRRPFDGEEVADVLAAILTREPDFTLLPGDLPGRVRQLLTACLQKDPKQRIHSMADARLAMDGAFELGAPGLTPTDAAPGGRIRWWVAALTAVVVGAAGAGAALWLVPSIEPDRRHYVHHLGEETFTRVGRHLIAVSNSARGVAYVADGQIYLLNSDDPVARPIPGTAVDPTFPVFAPDGQSIAFFAAGEISRVPVGGGTPVPITKVTVEYGMSWHDDVLVYATRDGIWRVNAAGGSPDMIARAGDNERLHAPQLLPDGKSILFAIGPALGAPSIGRDAWDDARIVVQALESGARKEVGRGGYPRYVSSGHLIYASGSTLFARPFNLRGLEPAGTPVPVRTGVQRAIGPPTGIAQYAVSDDGALAFISGDVTNVVDLVVLDRRGGMRVLDNSSGVTLFPRASPDGRFIVAQREQGTQANIWIYDVTRAQWRQLTSEGGSRPVWTRDGNAITFLRGDELWNVPAAGGPEERLPGTKVENNRGPDDWSPTEDVLLYTSPAGIHRFSSASQSENAPVLMASPGNGGLLGFPQFAPDGRAIAFILFENPRDPFVYLTPYPVRPGAQRKVTNELAVAPVWGAIKGAAPELYVSSGNALYVRQVTETSPTPTWLNPLARFGANSRRMFSVSGNANYDVLSTGDIVTTAARGDVGLATDRQTIQILLNWAGELKRLVR
jgi:serine/threonine-protein kinase